MLLHYGLIKILGIALSKISLSELDLSSWIAFANMVIDAGF